MRSQNWPWISPQTVTGALTSTMLGSSIRIYFAFYKKDNYFLADLANILLRNSFHFLEHFEIRIHLIYLLCQVLFYKYIEFEFYRINMAYNLIFFYIQIKQYNTLSHHPIGLSFFMIRLSPVIYQLLYLKILNYNNYITRQNPN